jgi:hypothetical protein
MHSYIISELARLHGEDLRRDAEHHRRGRELRRRRLPAVAAWVRSLFPDRAGAATAPSVTPTVVPYPRPSQPLIPRQAGPRDHVAPLLDVVEPVERRRCSSDC